jgi:hypothetical protein
MMLLTAGMLAAAWGCGAGRIIVNVDVGSFLSTEDANPTYGQVIPIPPGLPPVSIPIGPRVVEIPEGLQGVTDIEDADLSVLATVENESGSGVLGLRFFLARPGDDLFAGEPAAVFLVDLVPGETARVEDTVVLTEPARSFLHDAEIQFGYELLLDGSGSTEALQGAVRIEDLMIRVVNDPNLGG